MTSIASSSAEVNSMSDTDLATRLKRDVAFHRAAQLLADATACRLGLPPRGLSTLPPTEASWFRQTARQLIEIFERQTTGRPTDAEMDAAAAQQRTDGNRLRRALELRLDQERTRAVLGAMDRGHELGTWTATSPHLDQERAACRRCGRYVHIDVGAAETLSGPALTEGCLAAAGTEAR